MELPTSREEFLTRWHRNFSLTGDDDQAATAHVPCPWCAAADWAVFEIHPGDSGADEVITALGAHHTCAECGRGGRYLITHDGTTYTYQAAQTRGAPPPAWLTTTHLTGE